MSRTGNWMCATVVALLVGCAFPNEALAQLHFAGDAPRIYSIEPRDHLFRHEITLGASVLPLDAFYVGTAASVGYTYHFTDVWAWEVVRGFYAYNIDTALTSILRSAQVAPVNSNRRILSIVSSNVVFRPMFGKLALFNSAVVHAETFFVGGVGVAISNIDTGVAPNLGIGLNFWLSHAFAIRLDVADHFAVFGHGTDSVLQIMLSASFNFNIAKADNITQDPS